MQYKKIYTPNIFRASSIICIFPLKTHPLHSQRTDDLIFDNSLELCEESF